MYYSLYGAIIICVIYATFNREILTNRYTQLTHKCKKIIYNSKRKCLRLSIYSVYYMYLYWTYFMEYIGSNVSKINKNRYELTYSINDNIYKIIV